MHGYDPLHLSWGWGQGSSKSVCYNLFQIRMPNWDDEFDLDDYNPKKPPAKPKQPKKNSNQDDFFDLDDPAPSNTKLPALPKQNKPLPPPKSYNNYDDYEEIDEEVEEAKSPPKKQPEKSKHQQNYDDEEVPKPVVSRLPSISKQPSPKKEQSTKEPPKPIKQEQDDEEFYESLEDNKPKVVPKSQPQSVKKEEPQAEEEPYEQEFDDYGEDFEEVDEKPIKQLPKKSQTTANLKPKEKTIKEPQKLKTEEKKLVINTNKVFTNKEQKEKEREKPIVPPKPPMKENSKQPSKKAIEPPKKPIQSYHGAAVSQQKPMQRSASKRSLQSNDSRKHLGNSKVSTRRKTTEATNSRHMDLVEKQFPEGEERIGQYPPERLSRLNEQVREMIRKFNEELNELINRNMILLKEKPTERTHNAQEKHRILEQQLKSGGTALEVVENELDRLRGREGELREEEYQLIIEKRIEDAKETIKEMGKLVTRMKADVNSDGNKLSKHEAERRMAQELHQIKQMLMQTKKEEEKNEVTLKKVEKMFDELESKNSDKEYELSQQIDNARDKGVTLNVKQSTKKRYQELKLKSIALQNHKRVTESLARTKCQHLGHENDQMKTTLRSIDSQIANIHKSIEFSQQQSIKLIKKAKENAKIPSTLGETLDKIMKSIQENQALNYYEIRTEGNHSQASERPLKNSMYENMGSGSKEKPVMRGNSSKKQPGSAVRQKAPTPPPVPPPASDEINLMKPNFMKKKEKQEASPSDEKEKGNKLYQRVWNEEEEKRKQEENRRKQQQERKRVEEEKRKEQQAQKLAAAEEQKKKPFNLKKNRMNNEQKEKTAEPSPEVSKIAQTIQMKIPPPQQPKEEEKPSIGPKFMRLRNKNAQGNKNDISTQKPIEEIKKPIIEEPLKVEPKPQEQQPVFVPKRFNLRNKIEKKDQGYVPTADKSMEAKKDEPKKEEPKKQYAPNFSFKEEEPFKAAIPETKKMEEEIKIEEKPKFNLRLRDRQKKQADDSYMPTRLTEVDTKPVAKPQAGAYNPFDREPLKKEEPKAYQPSFKPAEEKSLKPSLDFAPPTKEIARQPILAPKEPVNNPYAAKEEPIINPYAPKEEAPKREREGPLKKNKLLNKGPKEKFNIYEQAEDITEAPHVPLHDPKPQIPVNDPPKQVNLAKTDELDLNAMLGIKKKEKVNDLDDLLGEVNVGKKKERKKNNDFFNDLEL